MVCGFFSSVYIERKINTDLNGDLITVYSSFVIQAEKHLGSAVWNHCHTKAHFEL